MPNLPRGKRILLAMFDGFLRAFGFLFFSRGGGAGLTGLWQATSLLTFFQALLKDIQLGDHLISST